ncbi:MAG: hypothetical protein ACTSVU_08640 [Promethearchaeota archaeon]
MGDSYLFTDPAYREIFIIISFVIIAISVENILILFYRSNNVRKSAKTTSKIFLAFAYLLVGDTLGFISLSILRLFPADIFSTLTNHYFYLQVWFFLGLGGFFSVFTIEHLYQDTFHTKYILSVFAALSFILNIFTWDHTKWVIFSYSGTILFLLFNGFLLFFLIFLHTRISNENRHFLHLINFGFFFYLINLLFANNYFFSLIDTDVIFLIMYISQLVGCFLLFQGFSNIPTFNEADWRETIQELYIISRKNSMISFYHNFRTPFKKPEELFSTYILGIESMIDLLDNSTDKSPVSIEKEIEQGDSKIYLLQNQDFLVTLKVKQSYNIYRKLLRSILEKFQEDYGFLIISIDIDLLDFSLFHGFQRELLHIIRSPFQGNSTIKKPIKKTRDEKRG